MIGHRARRAVAIAFVAAAATAGVAFAQTATPPAGNFGGGSLAVPVDEDTVAKDMLLSIRALPGGRIGVDGQLYARCALGTIKGDARLAADGSFTLRGDAIRKPLVGVTQTTTFVVKGRLTAAGGEGTASLKVRVRQRGRATRTCESATVSWALRRAAGAAAAPAPAPAESTLLYGLTSQRGSRANRAIVLHATSGGRSIDRLTFGFRTSCDRRRIVVADDLNISAEFDVAADGSFRAVERFGAAFSDLIRRTTVVVRGQFDQAGAAAGKLSVTERYTRRKTGRRVELCDTGTLAWSARP